MQPALIALIHGAAFGSPSMVRAGRFQRDVGDPGPDREIWGGRAGQFRSARAEVSADFAGDLSG